jgi:hypothetical protein
MNWYTIFYGITVADNVKSFFDTTSNIFTFFAVVSFIAFIISRLGRAVQVSESKLKNDDQDKTNPEIRAWEMANRFASKLFYPMLILSLVTWLGYSLTPTKKDCLMIVAGGAVGNFMQSDSSAASLPSDITSYLHLSLKNQIESLSQEDRQDLGVKSDKDVLIEKVKDLSKDELIKFLESQPDSSSMIQKALKNV